MQVAGRMAEVATGKAWEGIFQEKLASPLGMNRTRFSPVDPGHTPMIAGGAVSTLRDYSRFLTMVANGGVFLGRRILSESAIRAMQEDQVGNAKVSRDEFVERRRGKTHRGIYGLGMWREELDEKGNVVLMSSPSWAGCYPWIDKRYNIRGLILAHVDTKAAEKTKFSGFWSSPVLMNLVRAQLEGGFPSNPPVHKTGLATVSGADLFWESAGEGDPLILLHGHSLDRRMWDLQAERLSRHYRVIRYDLRGYGLSDLPVEGEKFRHADDLASLMDTLHIQKAHVVGLSLGAYVVADFLATHPDRILTATMASGGVYRGPGTRMLEGGEYGNRLREIEQTRSEGIEHFKERWREVLLRSTKDLSLQSRVTTMISDWSAWQPLHVEPALLLGPESVLRMTRNPPSLPVLWIAGEKDYDPARLQPFLQIFPDMKVVVLSGAGHLCNMDQPNAFSEALEDFLGKACPSRWDRAPDRLTVERQEWSYIRAPLDKKDLK
jgi:pimeloyl-ACP methyl ester carboxylesterase